MHPCHALGARGQGRPHGGPAPWGEALSGVARVRSAFRRAAQADRTALAPYFVAGYPSFSKCREALWEAKEAGVDLIELGLPFSDPVADGPTIQAATYEALRRGVTVAKTLRFVRDLRRDGFDLPLIGMTYANLLYAPGYERATQQWRAAGLDGAIVPDIPIEEAAPLRAALREEGLASVFLASPGTSSPRVREILRASTGFVYLVAVYGTTGARRSLAPETRPLLARVRTERRAQGPPLCVGFGVSGPVHVTALHQLGADGVIVGSALVERLRRGEELKSYLASLVRAGRAR